MTKISTIKSSLEANPTEVQKLQETAKIAVEKGFGSPEFEKLLTYYANSDEDLERAKAFNADPDNEGFMTFATITATHPTV